MVKTMVRQAVPLQPMEVNGGADLHLQPVEDPVLEQVDAPKGGCDPMESPRWSRLLAGPANPWREEPMLEQVHKKGKSIHLPGSTGGGSRNSSAADLKFIDQYIHTSVMQSREFSLLHGMVSSLVMWVVSAARCRVAAKLRLELGMSKLLDIICHWHSLTLDITHKKNLIHILSMTPYGMEQPFGQLGSAVPAVSPPNFLCTPSLLAGGAEQPQLSQPVFIGEVLQPLDHLHGPPLDSLQQIHGLLMLGAPELNAVLQAKQPQFPQLLLLRLVLQTLPQLRCPSLDTLQPLNVSLVVGGPKLNTAFEVRPHQCRVQGHDHFPSPAGHTISDTSQDAIGFLGHLGTLLAHIQLAIDQHTRVLLCWAAFQPLFLHPVALHGVVVTQVHKKLGGGTARTADPNWPKGYSIPYGIILSIETGGSWLGGSDRCLGTGWASVSKCLSVFLERPQLLHVTKQNSSSSAERVSLQSPCGGEPGWREMVSQRMRKILDFLDNTYSRYTTPERPAREKLTSAQVHKKLGGGTARTADPNWPKGCSRPYGVMLSIETGGSWPGDRDCCSGTGWASVELHTFPTIPESASNCFCSLLGYQYEEADGPHKLAADVDVEIIEVAHRSERHETAELLVKGDIYEELRVVQGTIADGDEQLAFCCIIRSARTLQLPPMTKSFQGLLSSHFQSKDDGRAKQPQVPQPLLIRLVLQTLHQLRCPSLDTLQHLNVSLVVGGPKLNTAFEVRPHQCRVQGHDHFPSPAGHTIFDTSQDAIGFLGHLGTLLAHIQAAVNQHPQVLLCQAAFQPLFPKPVALHGVAVAQVQDLALGLVKPHTIDLGPSIQPVQVPLQSLPTLKQINTPTQLGVICKLTEGALDPFVQIIDKDIKQNWPQHRALGNTACDRPPTGSKEETEVSRSSGTPANIRADEQSSRLPRDALGFLHNHIPAHTGQQPEFTWVQCWILSKDTLALNQNLKEKTIVA
ncbi:hypothetical protein QYF61_024908 [Mycteria americana]|uniref:Uncharacterized protein n=1 Tax=Mycteria americana TaxID=33587 RepID=A0AAN7N119_MYCAM|nr:hypothetical protein QYF61_024908 [Mycteria americana]